MSILITHFKATGAQRETETSLSRQHETPVKERQFTSRFSPETGNAEPRHKEG
jgi:hypothetical protein